MYMIIKIPMACMCIHDSKFEMIFLRFCESEINEYEIFCYSNGNSINYMC